MLLAVNIDDDLYLEFKIYLLRNRLKSQNVISDLIREKINYYPSKDSSNPVTATDTNNTIV